MYLALLRGLGALGAAGGRRILSLPGVGNQITSHLSVCLLFIECESGLYLYEGRCESNCPPRTYRGINPKEMAACLPCHYTCLTCAGESEGHCTSCHEESVPMPSGLKETREPKSYNESLELESLAPVEREHLSWGKRGKRETREKLKKKAVTKKILEPHDVPRHLFFCYPSRVVKDIEANGWYRRMSLLFALNLLLLIVILCFFLTRRFCCRNKERGSGNFRYRYSKIYSNGESTESRGPEDDGPHLSWSIEEE